MKYVSLIVVGLFLLLVAQSVGICASGLVAAWSFDEGTGNTASDVTGNGHNGTLSSPKWVVGKFGSALDFNGDGDRVIVPHHEALNMKSALTLEAWVYHKGWGEGPSIIQGTSCIIQKWRYPGQQQYVMSISVVGGVPIIRSHFSVTGKDYPWYDGRTPIPLNQWTHLATTYDGKEVRLFVNGKLDGKANFAGPIFTTDLPLLIGGYGPKTTECPGNARNYFKGIIDEVRVWNTALSEAEIATNMNKPTSEITGQPGGGAQPPACDGPVNTKGPSKDSVIIGADPSEIVEVNLHQISVASDAGKLSFGISTHGEASDNFAIGVYMDTDQNKNTGETPFGADYAMVFGVMDGDLARGLAVWDKKTGDWVYTDDDVSFLTPILPGHLFFCSLNLKDINNPKAIDFFVGMAIREESGNWVTIDTAPEECYYRYNLSTSGGDTGGTQPPQEPSQIGKLAIDFKNATTGNSVPHWILGFEFGVKESITVKALCVWDDMFWNTPGYGFAVKPQQVGLWKSDGTLLRSVFVSSSDPTIGGGTSGNYWGKWRFHSITPVVLNPGTNYIVAAQGGEPMVFNPVNPIWDSRVTFIRDRVVDVGSGNPNDPLVFPNKSDGGGNPGYFGANFIIDDSGVTGGGSGDTGGSSGGGSGGSTGGGTGDTGGSTGGGTQLPEGAQSCPGVPGHAYLASNQPMTWKAAKAYAESLGGHLATISNAAENLCVSQMIKGKRMSLAWIGFTDEAEEGKWVWVTGESVTFTNWYRGEPNNFGNIEHYAVIGSPGGDLGPWCDMSSISTLGFVVEWDNVTTGGGSGGGSGGSTGGGSGDTGGGSGGSSGGTGGGSGDTGGSTGGGRTLVIPEVTGSPGKSVTVPINISDASGVAGGDIIVSYDAKILKVTEVKATALSSGISLVANTNTPGKIIIGLAGSNAMVGGSGSLVDMIFTIDAGAAAGAETPVRLDSAEVYDINGLNIGISKQNGKVKIGLACVKGDVNGDGSVKSNDAILTLRISTGLLTPDDRQFCAADYNDDKQVRSNDAILILRKATNLIAPVKEIIVTGKRDITITLDEVYGEAGQSIEVPLRVDNPAILAGGDIQVAYNSMVLKATEVFSKEEMLIAGNVSEPGIVRIGFAATESLNREIVAYIKFDVISDNISTLSIKQHEVYDYTGVLIKSRAIDRNFISYNITPETSALLQNFPNPFNPDTWIPYQLKDDSDVIIWIFNLEGEVVRKLDLGHKTAGLYITQGRAAHWDGKNDSGNTVASGVYFYSLKTGNLSAVKKMMIIR